MSSFPAAVTVLFFLHILSYRNIAAQSTDDQLEEINLAVFEHVLTQANKPIWFGLEKPVNSFIGRTAELSELKLGQTDGKITIITGPRGIGKTELAKKYAQEIKHDNTTNILWLDSNTHESLVNSFKDLAVHIGNSLEEKAITTMLRETFDFFHNRKSLFILDHASSDNIIIRNIQTFLGRVKRIKIIVTSRDENWDEDTKILNLKPFTKENSVDYLKTVLRKEINMNVVENSAEKLSELLKYLPLALNRVSQHIIHKNTMRLHGEYTIDNCIQDLLRHQLTTEKPPQPTPIPDDVEIEKSILKKIQDEGIKLGKQIKTEVKYAWETLTLGTSKIGQQITNEANKTNTNISKQTAKMEKQVKNLFSLG